MSADLAERLEAISDLLPLLELLTVRQVIEAGEPYITAAGLNPWCINEGLATGDERAIGQWKIEGWQEALRARQNTGQEG